jgi:hypothetical protein
VIEVLIVEDDPEDLLLIKRAFKQANRSDYEISTASRQHEALDYLKSHRVDVVLLDLSLPDGHGIDTISTIRAANHEVAIVVLTGLKDEAVEAQCLESGAQEYLIKGEVSPALVPKVIRFALNSRTKEIQLEKANLQLKDQVDTKSHELETEEEKFRLLIDAIKDYAVVMLNNDGNVSTWNDGAQKLFEYSPHSVYGKHYSLFFPEGTNGNSLPSEHLKQAREKGRAEFEGKLVDRSGVSFLCHSIIRPLHENGNTKGFVFVSRDVTELHEAHSRALQAERLAAVGQMVTGLAHESRNALQRIQASVNRIVRRSRENKEILEIALEIERAGEDLSQLYEAVREYAAPIHLKVQNFNIMDIWREVWSQVEPVRSGREVRYEENTCDVDLSTSIDDYRLGQVFRNLIENTLAACEDPVRIEISCRDVKHRGASALEVTVSDNGPGFSAGAKERAFEAFFTTKQKGTGLGLAIIKRIVEAHGGQVRLGESVVEGEAKGAEIIMILPRNAENN